MSFSQIVNYILYALSGFCFGIFASRYSVLSLGRLLSLRAAHGLAGALTRGWPQLLFLLLSFILFPTVFSTRTELGAFVYYLVLIVFFNRGFRNISR